MKILVKKLNDDVSLPKYQRENDAGFDFHASETVEIPPGECVAVPTGLKMAIPTGYRVSIVPRSGLSKDTYLRIPNSPGTIDSGYRGEVKVLVFNDGIVTTTINKGDRIAQGILERTPRAEFKVVDELPDSERGEGGFGHTGVSEDV